MEKTVDPVLRRNRYFERGPSSKGKRHHRVLMMMMMMMMMMMVM
jgi:hypothetical protein